MGQLHVLGEGGRRKRVAIEGMITHPCCHFGVNS